MTEQRVVTRQGRTSYAQQHAVTRLTPALTAAVVRHTVIEVLRRAGRAKIAAALRIHAGKPSAALPLLGRL